MHEKQIGRQKSDINKQETMRLIEKIFGAGKDGKRGFHRDWSFWALVVTNLIVIVQALREGWPLGVIMWIYWGQSVAIGIFWFFKILMLREFTTEGLSIGDKPAQPTKETKTQVLKFFPIHYGGFHLTYAIFLSSIFGKAAFLQALAAIGVFAIYQGYSFFYNRKWEAKQKPNIGTMMFFPYARIIPMHLTIIFANSHWGQKPALVLFLFLKLLADVIMHVVEGKIFAGSKKTVSQPAQEGV